MARRSLTTCVSGAGGTNFSYRTVAEKFRMIESGMVPVIVPASDERRSPILASNDIPRARLRVISSPTSCKFRLRRGRGSSNAAMWHSSSRARDDQFAVLTTRSSTRRGRAAVGGRELSGC